MKLFALSAAVLLGACTEMHDYYPSGQVVSVDGREYLVRKLQGRENSYQAMENRPTMGQVMTGIDAAIYSRNVSAIEAATRCKVDMASIQNSRNNTIAAVNC